jgi:hypothetical protein
MGWRWHYGPPGWRYGPPPGWYIWWKLTTSTEWTTIWNETAIDELTAISKYLIENWNKLSETDKNKIKEILKELNNQALST